MKNIRRSLLFSHHHPPGYRPIPVIPPPPNISLISTLCVPHWSGFAITRKLHSTFLGFAYVFPFQLFMKYLFTLRVVGYIRLF